jgi:hypothetical protein
LSSFEFDFEKGMPLLVMMAHHATPAVTISKSTGVMPDEVDGFQPVAKGGGKRRGKGRFQSKQRTKAQEQRAKAAEVAAREQASDDVAVSSHQRSATEPMSLRADVGNGA